MHDPGPTDEQQAIADAVGRLARGARSGLEPTGPAPMAFPWVPWRRLAALGVFGIGSTEGGGAPAVLAVMEALGAELFPGPLVATFFALPLLDPGEAQSVLSGEELVSVSSGQYFPWGNDATWLLTRQGSEAEISRRAAEGPVMPSLAGEPWAQPTTEHVRHGPVPRPALVHGDLALAGYLLGAARARLVETAAHARDRHQFGHSLGEFQAVSHALARCEAATSSALGLARQCAWEWEQGADSLDRPALACCAASAASLEAALTCHQVFGAMGFSVEAGLWRASTKIRELSLLWSDPDGVRATVDEARRMAREGARRRSPAHPETEWQPQE